MAQTSTVQEPVNTVAVDKLSGAEGKIGVASFFLLAETQRSPEAALEWIGRAKADLDEAAEAIITAQERRELRRPAAVDEDLMGRDL